MPDIYNGKVIYDGKPCPTREVYEFLDDEGVEFIDKKIKSLVKARTEMFGKLWKNSQGFGDNQMFLDIKKFKMYELIDICYEDGSTDLDGTFEDDALVRPVLKVKGNYIINLHTDFEVDNEPITEIDMIDFYNQTIEENKNKVLSISSFDKEGTYWDFPDNLEDLDN